MPRCSRCGKDGGMFDVKLYNLPNKQERILCSNCYQEIMRTGDYNDQNVNKISLNKNNFCPSCGGKIEPNFKICPYCAKKLY